jgi:hypothetical protein
MKESQSHGEGRQRALALDAARRWWRVPLAVASARLGQPARLKSRYHVSGQAAERLDKCRRPVPRLRLVVARC